MELPAGLHRRIAMRLVAAVAMLAAALGACGEPAEEAAQPAPTSSVPATGAGPVQRAELEAARRLWLASGPDTYRYVIEDRCGECDPALRSPREVVVWTGQRFDPGAVSPSIEEVFVEIEQALDAGLSVAASYDPDLGYPVEVVIDAESQPLDGGAGWAVEALEPGLPGDEVSAGLVRDAERRWHERGPSAYEYSLTIFCDCPLAGSIRTRVEDGRVTDSQVLYDTDTDVSVTPMPIDDMFADLADLVGSADGVVEGGVRFMGSARFDPELGHPTWVGLDIGVVDGDGALAELPARLVMTVTELRALDTAS